MASRSGSRPKPLVPIGGRPILWHLMQHFATYGHRDFVLALGYGAAAIKRYFFEQLYLAGSLTLRMDDQLIRRHGARPPWHVTMVETGLDTPTGERLLLLAPYLDAPTFFVTYADGLADLDLGALLAYHRRMGLLATVTAVRRAVPFGVLEVEEGKARSFQEKPRLDVWVNGGYFVFERRVLDVLAPGEMLEQGPLQRLAAQGELAVFHHHGFWACMDTPKDAAALNRAWRQGAPWKVWTD
ncbi:MAG: glucose-1-phosphate cytidylyltransferase [Limnochordaceae bacterium]|nr:glucose-1-phosphate cytidylyltransferase [Limnochordaceae bacterium]